jgi:hypothetical protein
MTSRPTRLASAARVLGCSLSVSRSSAAGSSAGGDAHRTVGLAFAIVEDDEAPTVWAGASVRAHPSGASLLP